MSAILPKSTGPTAWVLKVGTRVRVGVCVEVQLKSFVSEVILAFFGSLNIGMLDIRSLKGPGLEFGRGGASGDSNGSNRDILLQCYLEAWAALRHGWIKELCSEGLPTESQTVSSSGSKQVEAQQKGTMLAQSKLRLALL
ncbi:hypothetical protein RHMOL_Rhmol03G0282100 [Rhododendron molle]|nr:hypothetical protein RHMOL_Rhmol03G0282100 [Rhododendron molle]